MSSASAFSHFILIFGIAATPFSLIAQATAPGGGYAGRRALVVRTFDGKVVEVQPRSNFTPDEATLVVQRIVSSTGLRPNFQIYTKENYRNASAGISADGVRVIVFDPAFIDNLNGGGANNGAASIFAHEIGHHLQGHTLLEGGSQQRIELEADEFSGWVMARLGYSLGQAQEVMARIAPVTVDPGDSHPDRASRLAAIARGYRDAPSVSAPRADASPTVPAERPADSPSLEGAYAAVAAFIDGMRRSDVTAVKRVLTSTARIVIVGHRSAGGRDTSILTADQVLEQASTPGSFDERTIDRSGEIAGETATVLHYYNYYIDGQRSHCGGERYTLQRIAGAADGIRDRMRDGPTLAPTASGIGGWQIVRLEDHQLKEGCPARP